MKHNILNWIASWIIITNLDPVTYSVNNQQYSFFGKENLENVN